jgi:N-acetylglucosamine malate deacetylase 1
MWAILHGKQRTNMGQKILVVAPHPDDETLGCGGTLLKHKKAGDEVHWVIMTDMDAKDGWSQKKMTNRETQIKAVAKAYGFKQVHRLGFAAAHLDEVDFAQVIHKVASVVQKIKPTVVYLPNRLDVHSDHRVTFDAFWAACKTFRVPFVKTIYSYETLSETEFSLAGSKGFEPRVFVDISGFLDHKLKIMREYKEEMMSGNQPRSIEALKALACLRGSRCGAKYAEAFQLWLEIR